MPISTREVKIESMPTSSRSVGEENGARGLVGRPRSRELEEAPSGTDLPRGGGSGGPAGLVAQPELDLGGRVLEGELDGAERLAECAGGVAQETSPCGARHADPLVAPREVDLAVVESVVVVLA